MYTHKTTSAAVVAFGLADRKPREVRGSVENINRPKPISVKSNLGVSCDGDDANYRDFRSEFLETTGAWGVSFQTASVGAR